MTWAGLDQRVFPRFSTRCDITISDRVGGTIKTKTQNIGVGGVCVILDKELEKLSEAKLRLILNESSPIECKARVVWMIRSKEPSSGKMSYDTGFEFMDLDPKDKQRIQFFIDQLHKSSHG